VTAYLFDLGFGEWLSSTDFLAGIWSFSETTYGNIFPTVKRVKGASNFGAEITHLIDGNLLDVTRVLGLTSVVVGVEVLVEEHFLIVEAAESLRDREKPNGLLTKLRGGFTAITNNNLPLFGRVHASNVFQLERYQQMVKFPINLQNSSIWGSICL
jgi:hypothetical protein